MTIPFPKSKAGIEGKQAPASKLTKGKLQQNSEGAGMMLNAKFGNDFGKYKYPQQIRTSPKANQTR